MTCKMDRALVFRELRASGEMDDHLAMAQM